MTIYRITVQVTTDVECGPFDSEPHQNTAVTKALDKVRDALGSEALVTRKVWVTGIARDGDEYMIFPRDGSLPEPIGPTTVSIS